MKIWLIEDNKSDIELFKHEFINHEIFVTTPILGKDLQEPDFNADLVVIDTLLVHTTGFEVLRNLDEKGKLCGKMVILISSAEPFKGKEWKSIEDKIDLFCEKPLREQKVFELFEAVGYGRKRD